MYFSSYIMRKNNTQDFLKLKIACLILVYTSWKSESNYILQKFTKSRTDSILKFVFLSISAKNQIDCNSK